MFGAVAACSDRYYIYVWRVNECMLYSYITNNDDGTPNRALFPFSMVPRAMLEICIYHIAWIFIESQTELVVYVLFDLI